MNVLKTLLYINIIIAAAIFGGCIEDGFTTSPSDQPSFSVDTLDLGLVFTGEGTPTSRFVIYNRHDKQLSLSSVSLSGPDADRFRLNVDGQSGRTFANVDIRGGDSIYVFVEATLPEADLDAPQDFRAQVDVITNGVSRSVVLAAQGQNVRRYRGVILEGQHTFDASRPYQIYDSLVVAKGSRLTIEAGARLCFHDEAMLIVRGTLITKGTPEAPVVLEGDRQGNVVGDISFEIMSRQWIGLFFTMTSVANNLSHTIVKNTWQGVTVAGDPDANYSFIPQLRLTNCRLRNSGDLVLEAYHTRIVAAGCEFAEGGGGLVYTQGGDYTFNHCTFANYYLFSALGGPAIQLAHLGPEMADDGSGLPWLKADFTNSIIYGLGSELSHGDLTGTGVTFRRCLLKSEGTDDDNFINCLWAEDPMYYTVREDYIFDYRLKPESAAAEAADPELTLSAAGTDAYGNARTAPTALGAYVMVESDSEI